MVGLYLVRYILNIDLRKVIIINSRTYLDYINSILFSMYIQYTFNCNYRRPSEIYIYTKYRNKYMICIQS